MITAAAMGGSGRPPQDGRPFTGGDDSARPDSHWPCDIPGDTTKAADQRCC